MADVTCCRSMPFFAPQFRRSVSEPGCTLVRDYAVLRQISEEGKHLATSAEGLAETPQQDRPAYEVARQSLEENGYSESDIQYGFKMFHNKYKNVEEKNLVAEEVARFIEARGIEPGKIPISGTVEGKGLSAQGNPLLEFNLEVPHGDWGAKKQKTITIEY